MKTLLALILTLGIINVFAMDYYDNRADQRFEAYLTIEKANIERELQDKLADTGDKLSRAERDLIITESLKMLIKKVNAIKAVPIY
jgi:secreted protein with Ig-like and vWFA domain